MSLKSFRIENQKALRVAECNDVPPMMIICGANGTGKSTLLWALKQRTGVVCDPDDTQILYQGPHRAIRRQSVQRRWFTGPLTSYIDGLASDVVQQPEGMSIPYPARSPDNVDETGSTIKHVLGRLENRRQSYIAARVDAAVAAGELSLSLQNVAQIFEPLGDIVSRLLPHLHFEGMDFSQEDNIKAVFKRDNDAEPITLDLDDLSSGEKSVVLLFLPLVEAEIRANLERSASSSDASKDQDTSQSEIQDRVFLLDEPELHLHPDLQRRMLGYMRERSSRGHIQFVLITHSPTILDEATDDELFVLAPAQGDKNQLHRAASPSERLSALRELTGESYFLGTGRNLVCVEGETSDARFKASDRSLIEILNPKSSRYTFLPMGGKAQVAQAVRRLKESLPVDLYSVTVVGLVDSDQGSSPPSGCIAWPFCEVENALIAPVPLAAVVTALVPNRSMDAASVNAIIGKVGAEMRNSEISVRLTSLIGRQVLVPRGKSVEEVQASIDTHIDKLREIRNPQHLKNLFEEIVATVDAQLEDGSFVRRFRGKELLRGIYRELALPNISYSTFCYRLAELVRNDAEASAQIESTFVALDSEVDTQLSQLLTRS